MVKIKICPGVWFSTPSWVLSEVFYFMLPKSGSEVTCRMRANKNKKLKVNIWLNKYFKIVWLLGGTLIFDEADIELQAENILITDGGILQVYERTWDLFMGNLSPFLLKNTVCKTDSYTKLSQVYLCVGLCYLYKILFLGGKFPRVFLCF